MKRILCSLLLLSLAACKHPLAVVGEGEIIETLAGDRGCTPEEIEGGDSTRCENEVFRSSYEVNYRAVPRDGWEFVGWRGTACGKESVFPDCAYSVSRALVEAFDAKLPDFQLPFTTAVFKDQRYKLITLEHVRDISVSAPFTSLAKFEVNSDTTDIGRLATATVDWGNSTGVSVVDLSFPEENRGDRNLSGPVISSDAENPGAYTIFHHDYPGYWFTRYAPDGLLTYVEHDAPRPDSPESSGDLLLEISGFSVTRDDHREFFRNYERDGGVLLDGQADVYALQSPYIGSFNENNELYVVTKGFTTLTPGEDGVPRPSTLYFILKYDEHAPGGSTYVGYIGERDSPLEYALWDSQLENTYRHWVNLGDDLAALIVGGEIHFIDLAPPCRCWEPNIYWQVHFSDNTGEIINDVEVHVTQEYDQDPIVHIAWTTNHATYYLAAPQTPHTEIGLVTDDLVYSVQTIEQAGDHVNLQVPGGYAYNDVIVMYIADEEGLGDLHRYEYLWDNDTGRTWTKTAEARGLYLIEYARKIGYAAQEIFNSYGANYMIFQTAAGYSMYRIAIE